MSKLTIDTNAPKAVQTQAPQATEPATDGKDAALAAIIQQVYGKNPTPQQVANFRTNLENRRAHSQSLKSSAAAHAQQAGMDGLSQVSSSQTGSPMVGATEGAQTLSASERQDITNLRQGAVLPRPQASAISQDGAGELLERLGHGEGGWRSDFDGSAWTAALWSFMKNSLEDDQAWRRVLKDLQAADSELQQAFKGLEIALTELKQSHERQAKMLELADSGSKFSEKIVENKAQELVGHNPMKGSQKEIDSLDNKEASPDSSAQIREIDSKLAAITTKVGGHAEGQPPVRFLTPTELSNLSDADQKAYAELHSNRYVMGGLTDKLATLRQDARRRGFDPFEQSPESKPSAAALKSGEVEIAPESATGAKPMEPEFREMLDGVEADLLIHMTSLLRDPRAYGQVRQNRSELSSRVNAQNKLVDKRHEAIDATQKELDSAAPDQKADLAAQLKSLQADRAIVVDQQEVMLDALVSLDDQMFANRPGLGTAAFAGDVDTILKRRTEARGKLDEDKHAAHDRVTNIFKDLVRGSGSARYKVNHPTADHSESSQVGSASLSDDEKAIIRKDAASDRSASQADRIDALKARASAGGEFHSGEAELFTLQSAVKGYADLFTNFVKSIAASWERSAMQQTGEAGAQFGQAEKESYGMLQKSLGKIQQLIEQLINLQKL